MSIPAHAASAFALTLLAATGAAQCTDLDLSFARPRGDGVTSLVVHDAGSGPRLFAASLVAVSAWETTRWTNLPPAGFTPRTLRVHDFGSGPQLVAGGAEGAVGRIARWDGAAWTQVGAAFDGVVYALATFDDGSTSRLVATGAFEHAGATATAGIAIFDGAAWSPVGGGIEGIGRALTTLDRGNGPELIVGGAIELAGGQPIGNLASWNGASWSPFGSGADAQVRALLASGTPGAQVLFVGGEFTAVDGVSARYAARLDNGTWSALGTGIPIGDGFVEGVHAFLPDGPNLIAAGIFSLPGSPSSTDNVARFDGTNWQPLGPGLGTATFLGVDALAHFDANDGGGARVFAAGNFSPLSGQPNSIAMFDGARWVGLRDDGARGLLHQPSQIGATSAAIWNGDLVLAGHFDGAGAASDAQGVARFDGTTWSRMGTFQTFDHLARPTLVRALDFGGGPELVMGMYRFEATDVALPVYRWNGADWIPFTTGSMAPNQSTHVADAIVFDDGSGPMLYVGGQTLRATTGAAATTVLRWDGANWSPVGASPAAQASFATVTHFEVHDDGTGSALYAVGTIDGGVQRWNGSTWSLVGSGLSNARDLEPFDDGTGTKLYAAGVFQTGGTGPVHGLQRWDGAAWTLVPSTTLTQSGGLTQLAVHDDGSGHGARLLGITSSDDLVEYDGAAWSVHLFTEPYFTFAFLFADDRLPGGGGIVLHGNFREVFAPGSSPTAQAGVVIVHDCPRVTSFCAGDGQDAQLGVACPCANTGASGHGCAWNASGPGIAGGRLDATGSPLDDDVVLAADTLPASGTSLFFQGTADPAGAVFGDGLRCASGSVIRLRTRTNQMGAAAVPLPGEPSLATLGQVVPGSGAIRAYQVWFRVAASFCTSAPFNTTNALRVRW